MSVYSKIKNGIKNLKFEIDLNSKKADDAYAMAIIQPLLNGNQYLPINGGALRPFCMAYILNEILISQRKSIIEFGSGISTILIARLIKLNNLSVKFISIEHNKDWIDVLNSQLKNEGLHDIVEIVHADLVKQNSELGEVISYEFKKIEEVITDIKFDLVIVDGPPANIENNKYSRFPVLLYLKNNLSNNYCFLLDDAERRGENTIIKDYKNRYPNLMFTLVGKTLGVFRNEVGFNPIPIYYSKKK